MKNTLFTGSGVALVTPFHKDGVDYETLGQLIEFQISNHTDAIIICGTTGESATMPDEEHLKVIEFTVKQTAGRIPVIAGTGSNDTAHGVELSKEAQKAGVDGLLCVTPYYNKTTQKGLEKHFTMTADAVNIPIILYNVPSRTGLNISVDCVKALANHPNIVALKEASGNISYAAQVFAACGDCLDVYSGNDDIIVPLMSLGGKGVISVAANILPQEIHDIAAMYMEGDVTGSARLQLQLLELINALFIEVNPIPVKTAMNLMGMNAGELRMPLCEMDEGNLAKLKAAMKRCGISIQ